MKKPGLPRMPALVLLAGAGLFLSFDPASPQNPSSADAPVLAGEEHGALLAFREPAAWLVPREERVGPSTVEAVDEMRAGRFWHATRMLEAALPPAAERAPEERLLLARAHLGWRDWAGVVGLLRDARWLDEIDAGVGWALLGRALEGREAWEEASRAYARYLELAPGDDARGRRVAEIRRILALARGGSPERSLEALGGMAADAPGFLASWTALEVARTLARQGLPDPTTRALAMVGDPTAKARGRTLTARALLEAGDTVAALGAYRELARSMEAGPERGDVRLVAGELALARRDSAGARTLLAAALEETGRGRTAGEAARLLLGLGGPDSRALALVAARALAGVGASGPALEAFRRALEAGEEGPGSLSLDDRLLRARLLSSQGSREEAASELKALADSAPPEVAAPALQTLARLRARQGRTGEARALQDRLVADLPERPEAVDVIFFRGDDAHDQGLLEMAAEYYATTREMAPALDRSGLARMRLGQIHLTRGEPAAAAEVFEGYLEDFPEGRRWEEASYWAARSRLLVGDSLRARTLLDRLRTEAPLSYYAILTAHLLDRPFEPVLAEAPPPELPGWAVTGLAQVDVLGAVGLEEGAGVAVERLSLRARSGEVPGAVLVALGDALNRRGLTMEGINLGWEARRAGREWDRPLLRVVYPMPYREIVLREAREWNVDPWLVAGLIRQESAFWHRAVSRAGALGLMQVLPSTGAELARAVGPEDFGSHVLLGPEVNVHLGVRFMSDMLQRFGPELPLVLSAYNAGPTRATRWRDFPEAVDTLRFTERIPFAETRGYVKNVTRNLHLYRWLYGETERESSERPGSAGGVHMFP